MYYVVALFCIFMTGLTVWKDWDSEKTKKSNIIAALIAIGTGITGYFILYAMLPTPASPQLNDIFFYGRGRQNEFSFCCEFMVRNDGETNCSLDKVEFTLSDVQFKVGKSVLLTVGMGGSGGGRYGGGPAPIKNEIATSYLPQSISSINQSFKVVGTGKSLTLPEKYFADEEINVVIKAYFSSNSKTIVLERTVPVLYREMDNVRF